MTDAEKIKNEFNLSLISQNAKEIKALITELKTFKDELFSSVYPVGSIYISAVNISPEILFGGKWCPVEGKFLLGAGGSYKAGSTGGEAQVTLSESELPAHRHKANEILWNSPTYNGATGYAALRSVERSDEFPAGNMSNGYVGSAGGNMAHNNMPPYICVYIWQRTG